MSEMANLGKASNTRKCFISNITIGASTCTRMLNDRVV
jgi:hypothetical protein